MPLSRRVRNPPRENHFSSSSEFTDGVTAAILHRAEHLQQAPTFPPITLGSDYAFPFEVYVVDESVTPGGGQQEAIETLLDQRLVRWLRGGEHFR